VRKGAAGDKSIGHTRWAPEGSCEGVSVFMHGVALGSTGALWKSVDWVARDPSDEAMFSGASRNRCRIVRRVCE
jgi:hypothetical protein